jgi:DNA primase
MSYSDQEALAYQAFRQAVGKSKHRRANCPFCPTEVGKYDTRTSLAFNVVTAWYQCWRCGTRGKLREVPEHILLEAQGLSDNEVKRMELPSATYELAGDDSVSLRGARKYLRKRGISEAVWKEADLRGCTDGWLDKTYFGKRIIVPVRLRAASSVVGFVARDWTNKQKLRYRYPKGMARGKFLFNQAALFVKTEEPLLIVEGVFDALPYWPNAVACLGKPSEDQREIMLEATRPLVVALDGDAHDAGWALGLWLQFQGMAASSVRLPPKSDPNDVDRQWLIDAAREAVATG